MAASTRTRSYSYSYPDSDSCAVGYVADCSGDGDCCLESWIGDDFCDGVDQADGCDLSCFDNDGGDCDGDDNWDDESPDYSYSYSYSHKHRRLVLVLVGTVRRRVASAT